MHRRGKPSRKLCDLGLLRHEARPTAATPLEPLVSGGNFQHDPPAEVCHSFGRPPCAPSALERRALSWNWGFPKSANCDSPCSEVDHGAKLLFGPAQAGRFPCRRRPISSRCGSGFAGEPVVLGQAGGAPSPHRHTGAAAARPPAWHRQARALSRLPDATREGNARYHHARAGR